MHVDVNALELGWSCTHTVHPIHTRPCAISANARGYCRNHGVERVLTLVVGVGLTGDFCPLSMLHDSATHLRQYVHEAKVALQGFLIQMWHRDRRACGSSHGKRVGCRRCIRLDGNLATCTPAMQ